MKSSRFSASFYQTVAISLAFLFLYVAICQSADQITDPAVVQAQTELNIAKAKQATAEAELAKYKAQIGQITSTLPKGTTAAQGLNVEGNILAYRAAKDVAEKIAKDVIAKKAKKVVFFSPREINNQLVLQAFSAQVDLLQSQITDFLKPIPRTSTPENLNKCDGKPAKEITKAFVPPLFIIDTALQVLGLFKVDRTLTGHDIELNEFAIYALVGENLLGTVKVVYPPLYYPNAFNPSGSPVYAKFNALLEAPKKLEQASSEMGKQKTKLSKEAEEVKGNTCKSAFYTHDLTAINDRQIMVKSTESAVNKIIAELTKPDEQSGLNLIRALINAEHLATEFSSAYLLQIKPISAGGSTLTTTNIFGSKLSFSGGVIISYMLIDDSGTLVAAGTIPLHGGYFPAKDMK